MHDAVRNFDLDIGGRKWTLEERTSAQTMSREINLTDGETSFLATVTNEEVNCGRLEAIVTDLVERAKKASEGGKKVKKKERDKFQRLAAQNVLFTCRRDGTSVHHHVFMPTPLMCAMPKTISTFRPDSEHRYISLQGFVRGALSGTDKNAVAFFGPTRNFVVQVNPDIDDIVASHVNKLLSDPFSQAITSSHESAINSTLHNLMMAWWEAEGLI